jgi:hypothetical protein
VVKRNASSSNESFVDDGRSRLLPHPTGPEQELKARQIVAGMADVKKIRDLPSRRQLAVNLGRILSQRKNKLNLSELVVAAGISENPDPARLGRFRILPEKDTSRAAIKRLSQDALAYVRLVTEVAKVTGDVRSILLEELVLGTRFDLSEMEAVEIEPFEQLLTLVQKKIDALDSKYDLAGYFLALRENNLMPTWSGGPRAQGRYISRSCAERPDITGWQKEPGSLDQYANSYWRYQAMPCVPLCRIPQTNPSKVCGTIKIGEGPKEEANLYLFWRLFLGIGMYHHEYFDGDKIDPIVVKDPVPRPYLIAVQEIHYAHPSWREWLTDEDPRARWPNVVTGGRNLEQGPIFFFDDSSELKIEEITDHFLFEETYPGWFEEVAPLDLKYIRKIFGKQRDTVRFFDGDALSSRTLPMTLAPLETIAELMESNLLSHSFLEFDSSPCSGSTFLDVLARDVERLTSSLHKFLEASRDNLNAKHRDLLNQFEREKEEEKGKAARFST